MKTLFFYCSVSLLIHLLLFVAFLWVGRFEQAGPMPISGGGGGVEIVSISPPHPPSYFKRSTASTNQNDGPVDRRDIAGESKWRQRSNLSLSAQDGLGEGTGSGSGSESGTDSLLTEIRKRIERAREYPSFARQQGVEGIAEVRFRINLDGSLGVSQVVRSSGSALLDEAALATLRRATPYPAYPDPLQVKIEFSLRD